MDICKFWKKTYRLADLNTAKNILSSTDLRKKVKVLIIDNDPFPKLENLRNNQFDIMQISDIEDFNAVVSYQIIICDIRGVGHRFSQDMEGAYIAKTLRKQYPFKQIAVYSADSSYKIDSIDSDGIKRIKKDYDIETWCSCIDELIKKVADPKEVWKTTRDYLLNKEIPIDEVVNLESEYVDICLNRPQDLTNFPKTSKVKINDDVRSIIQSMIAGVILNFIS